MSSLITHITIAEILKSEYVFDNKFILGCTLPDIYKKMNFSRDITHFISVYNEKEIPNIERFLNEYINGKTKNLISYGYLMHLIQDKIWFTNYIPKYAQSINNEIIYLKDNSKHLPQEFSKDIYEDYNFVDNYLINKYNLNIEKIKEEINKLCTNKEIPKVINENISVRNIDKNRKNVFISTNDINLYIDETLNECRKILNMCIKNNY